MSLDPRQELELTGGGDTMLHYHNQDRGPFPIPYGSFYDMTDQVVASTTTAYAMRFDSTAASKGVRIVSDSRITVEALGTYNFQFSAQLANTDSAAHDIHIWFAKNGTAIPASNTVCDVPAKHGGTHGHTVASWNMFVTLERNDYVEIMWSGDSTTLSLEHFGTAVSPTRPATPSVILTVNLVSV